MSTCLLNLGCGLDIRDGWVNHDISQHDKRIAVVHNLNVRPWPWKPSTFDRVDAISVFEHLEIDLIKVMDECWRILKGSGALHIKYPLLTSPFVRDDPTHRWFWSEKVLDFVIAGTKYEQGCPYYTKYKWNLMQRTVGPKNRNCWAQLSPRGK